MEAFNAQSVILLVRYGEFEALLTGDAPVDVEEAILDDLPSELEVLKVGHHGSNTSTSALLLARASPEVAIVSVGARNRYGHPHAEVMGRLDQSGARVLRTDLNGDIVIRARSSGLYEVRSEWWPQRGAASLTSVWRWLCSCRRSHLHPRGHVE